MEMLKLKIFIFIFSVFLVSNVTCRTEEMDDSDSIEIPVRKPNRSSNNGFSVFRPADDALFNFINKLVNTSYLSSKMVLNRVKTQSEIRKQIEDQVEEFLESLPNVPIPVLDDMGPPPTKPSYDVKVKSNYNIKDGK